jgi:hypothetical protein
MHYKSSSLIAFFASFGLIAIELAMSSAIWP